MELLAPVGSKESFITALRAGADAVYVGVPDFNARIAATPLGQYDLAALIDHAHARGVKVYLALNTLVKHEEISDAVRRIAAVAALRPDAVIVQDLGIAAIVRDHFPSLELHASTQMAVHNRPGVDVLAAQGFRRVILARELTFPELRIVAKGAPVPLEVFVHGALCFSLSGLCLFSSHIGGMSGNRGRCTQPCRRRWTQGGRTGYLFSPRDLELIEHVPKLKDIGIASLKIEGRMRSSEYVYRAVKAYRLVIDAPAADHAQALAEARAILAGDAAREKTACLFAGRDPLLFQPQKAQCLGTPVGTLTAVAPGSVTLAPETGAAPLCAGDRLRLANPDTDTTLAFTVKTFARAGDAYVLPLDKSAGFVPGNPVYRIVNTAADQRGIQQEIDALYGAFAARSRGLRRDAPDPGQAYTALISNLWKAERAGRAAPHDVLWLRYDDPAWLPLLPQPSARHRHVFALGKENFHHAERLPAAALPRMAGELPPFIGQRDTALFQRHIDRLSAAGLRAWVLNNPAHAAFFGATACELIAGPYLYVWNAYAAAFLARMGIRTVTAAWEDEFLNIRRMAATGLGARMIVYLFGYPALVRSRMLTAGMLSQDSIVSAAGGEADAAVTRLHPVFDAELTTLLPDRPVNLFTFKRRLAECGIAAFGIDLAYIPPNAAAWDALAAAYAAGENVGDSQRFNFKRGVR